MQSQLTVRVPKDLNYEISNYARKFYLKRSDIVRIALEKFLGEVKTDERIKPYEKVKNLLGILDSGISNLGEAHREYLLKRIKKNA